MVLWEVHTVQNKLDEIKKEYEKELDTNVKLRKCLSEILYEVNNISKPNTLNELKEQNSVLECIIYYEDRSNKMMQMLLNIRQKIEYGNWKYLEEELNDFNIKNDTRFAYCADNIDVSLNNNIGYPHIEYNEDNGKTVLVL